MATVMMKTFLLPLWPRQKTPTCGAQIRTAAGEEQINTVIGIESGTICLPVWQSSGNGGWAVPQQRGGGRWQLPARWSLSFRHGNECHVARIVVLCNNKHKRNEVKWQRGSSHGGISFSMVRVAVTMQQSTQKRGG
jgi:hypothetical protein